MSVSAVLLAAGASTRFGSPKMFAPVPPEGRPMLAHVIETWRGAGLAEIVVVLGKDAPLLRELIEERFLRVKEGDGRAGAREGSPGLGPRGPATRPLGSLRRKPRLGIRHVLLGAGRSGGLARESLDAHRPLPCRSSLSKRIFSSNDSPGDQPPRGGLPHARRARLRPPPRASAPDPAALAARVLSWPDDARLNRLFAERDVKILHLEGFDETILLDVDRPADLRVPAGIPA